MRAPRFRASVMLFAALLSGFGTALAQAPQRPKENPTPTAGAPAASASGYVLGNEDVVQIQVYLHPELDRVSTIDANGDVTFAPIGANVTSPFASMVAVRSSSGCR